MSRDAYRHGDYNVICENSGFKVKASDCRMTWNGYFVHKRFWEPRHPQDFVRSSEDRQSVPIPRPEGEDVTYVDITPDDL